MEQLSPTQRQLRSHIETGIALASPFLDAVLAVGERISRFAEPRDYEYYPVRGADEPEANGEGSISAGEAGTARPVDSDAEASDAAAEGGRS